MIKIGIGLVIGTVLSAKILTFTTTGEYELKNGETKEHGIKVATELAKQNAMEQAGTAVVSSFSMVRASDGSQKAISYANTYAAGIIKTNVIKKEVVKGVVIVNIEASVDDSKVEEYLKSGPALHDKMNELKRSNDDMKHQLSITLDALNTLDNKYKQAVATKANPSEIAKLKHELNILSNTTDKILQSLGEYKTKTGLLYFEKGSLAKAAIAEQLRTQIDNSKEMIIRSEIDDIYSFYASNLIINIDPSSIKLSNQNNGLITLEYNISFSPERHYDLSKTTSDTKTMHNPFSSRIVESVSGPNGNRIGTDINFISARSLGCDFNPSNSQCKLAEYAMSKTIAITTGIPHTKYTKKIPLQVRGNYGFRSYEGCGGWGGCRREDRTFGWLGLSNIKKVTINDIPKSELENLDNLFSSAFVDSVSKYTIASKLGYHYDWGWLR